MTERVQTLADDLMREAKLLRRRFIRHTRPKGPLTLDQARDLCRRMTLAIGEIDDRSNQ